MSKTIKDLNMAKFTDYETSKKLKELGIKVDYSHCWEKGKEEAGLWNSSFELEPWGDCKEDDYYPAYDLETIIDLLPAFIEKGKKHYRFWMWNDGLGYYESREEGIYDMEKELYQVSNDMNDDNLATTAAKLFIELNNNPILEDIYNKMFEKIN